MSELNLFGVDLFGEPIKPKVCKMAESFTVPPFSVLDARQGLWQNRKRAWIALGIKSELGRGANTLGLSAECEEKRQGTYAAAVYGSGGPATMDDQRKAWRDTAIDDARQASPGGNMMPAMKQAKDGITTRGTGNGEDMGVVRKRGGVPVGDSTTVYELGRGDEITFGDLVNEPGLNHYRKRNGTGLLGQAEQAASPGLNHYRDENKHTASGSELTIGRAAEEVTAAESGTSIFDPVLCELAYRWFCPSGGHVLDPFAGGSVRGIVAAKLGYRYCGIDLRSEQIAANEEQGRTICPDNLPQWLIGDAKDCRKIAAGEYDFLFSCPPYYNLEVYSDNPADLSTFKTYAAFREGYRRIISEACSMLKPNRFACFVVGDVRDDEGFYLNFPADTTAAFSGAGMRLYNEAVLVTQVGSLPIRVGKQFGSYRKVGKTHQNVLVFFKGDPRTIKEWAEAGR